MERLDINQPLPTTDEDAQRYIPDNPATRGLYRVYREQGNSIVEAMRKVLEAVVQAHEQKEAR